MSFLVAGESFPPQKRKRYRNERPNDVKPRNKYEDIIVVGYHCKMFRDDVMAQYIEDGNHLIPWMGDETLMIDRYDCRGHLYAKEEFECPGNITLKQLSPDEVAIEKVCDEERYLGLTTDVEHENYLEEEAEKRLRVQHDTTSAQYCNVAYEYKAASYDGSKEYDPNDCFIEDSNQENDGVPQIVKLSEIQRVEREQVSSESKFKKQDGKPVKQDSEIIGIYQKPADLEIPSGIDVPDSQKSHSIIEKTALLISKHGTQMEIVLKTKQAGNPQFDFLNFGNWLNPYYKLILQKIKDGSYEVEKTSEQATARQRNDIQRQDSVSTDNGSDSSDENEYVHPLLQAHLRPVKTNAEVTTDQALVSDGLQRPAQLVTSSRNIAQRPLPQGSYGNAAAVYMARKYENSLQDIPSPKDVNADEDEGNVEPNWADNLEEDQNHPLIDARNFAYMNQIHAEQAHLLSPFTVTSLIPPPPPPGQENEDDVMDTNFSLYAAQMAPPPPPPGCTDLETTGDNGYYVQQQQQQQQQQQHIVPPPPDLKSVVDKLADYVSRNGEEFEEQVKHKKDPRFAFLKSDNIYYPYYLYKKQHFILEVATLMAEKKKEEEEKASKPLSFALKTKKQVKKPIGKLKAVEFFKESEDEDASDAEKEEEPVKEHDGYRPNVVKKRAKEKEATMEEKAKETMEQAKLMIAEAQKKQREQQQQYLLEGPIVDDDTVNTDRQVQLERRRKAAAFIGMLKKSNTQEGSSSSSDDSEYSSNESEESESEVRPKRHFQEKRSEIS